MALSFRRLLPFVSGKLIYDDDAWTFCTRYNLSTLSRTRNITLMVVNISQPSRIHIQRPIVCGPRLMRERVLIIGSFDSQPNDVLDIWEKAKASLRMPIATHNQLTRAFLVPPICFIQCSTVSDLLGSKTEPDLDDAAQAQTSISTYKSFSQGINVTPAFVRPSTPIPSGTITVPSTPPPSPDKTSFQSQSIAEDILDGMLNGSITFGLGDILPEYREGFLYSLMQAGLRCW